LERGTRLELATISLEVEDAVSEVFGEAKERDE
jgi:hypothetical protein